MRVYIGNRLIVTETNLAFALPYWKQRKQTNKRIRWEFV